MKPYASFLAMCLAASPAIALGQIRLPTNPAASPSPCAVSSVSNCWSELKGGKDMTCHVESDDMICVDEEGVPPVRRKSI